MKQFQTLLFCSLLIGFETMAQLPNQSYLNSMDYEELLDLFNQYESDSLAQERIAYTYLNKARKENDTVKVARGYDRLARTFHPQKNIIYADSLIEYTKDWQHITYPAMGYILKAYEFGLNQDLKNSYKYFLQANKIAESNGNLVQQNYIMDRLIYLKLLWGNRIEALDLQHRRHQIVSSEKFLKELEKSSRPGLKSDLSKLIKQNLLLSYEAYIYCYLRINKIDSAKYYWNLHQDILKMYENYDKIEVSNWARDAEMEMQYFKNNYAKSIEIADSIMLNLKLTDNIYNLKNCLLFKGLSKNKLQQYEEGIKYLLRADSIYEINKNLSDVESDRALFQEIGNYYARNGDYRSQIKYLDKMISLDSLSLVNASYLEPEYIRTYETPRLLKSKEIAINALKRQNHRSQLHILLIAVLLVFSFFLMLYYYRQKVLFKRRFDLVIQRTEAKKTKTNKKGGVDISKDIVEDILKRLTEFEQNEGYLESSISLNSLASQFHTNSSYLSKVLNFHKQTNFPQYLNDLRVNYAIKEIKNNPNFRKYTVEAIALECGYKNSASFSRAFYKNAGFFPSFYISELNKLET
jgi:AraC-like DNA-binding protein